MLAIGQTVDVVILDVDREKERVSLGLKQLQRQPVGGHRAHASQSASTSKARSPSCFPTAPSSRSSRGSKASSTCPSSPGPSASPARATSSTIDQEIEAVVLGINKEEQKISLGVRQLEPNPWDEIETRYPIGTTIKGQVRNLTAYGAFVELEDGIDGMIHVSDLSWTRKINHPSEVLKKGEEVEATVLRNRQGEPAHQPWHQAARGRSMEPTSTTSFKVGDLVKGTVAKIASFGAFVQLEDDIDGLDPHLATQRGARRARSRTSSRSATRSRPA